MPEKGWFPQSPISGERVKIKINNQILGPVLTGGDGMAVVRYHPPQTGTYQIQATLVDNPRHRAPVAEGLLLYGPLGKKVVVVTVDATQTLPESPPFSLLPSPRPQSMAKASEVLKTLAQKYQLIYIQTGGHLQIPETRLWLSEQDFPKALLLPWKISDQSSVRTEQVMDQLSELKRVSPIHFGITRSVADVEAFLLMGMEAILISGEEDLEFPEGAKVIDQWEGILPLIDGS